MRPFIALCVAVLVVATPPAGLSGQEDNRAAAIRSLSAGDSIRLDASGLGRVEGRFVFADTSTLTLTSHAVSLPVRSMDLERLWVRGRETRKGALIGSAAGAVGGIVFGVLISQVACEPVDGGDCTTAEVAAVFGLLGAAGVGAVGAGVGFAIPGWRLRFPSN